MYYLLKLDIDCKTCLNNLLLELLEFVDTDNTDSKAIYYNPENYDVLIKFSHNIDILRTNITNVIDDNNINSSQPDREVLQDIQAISEPEYQNQIKNLEIYQHSFWD